MVRFVYDVFVLSIGLSIKWAIRKYLRYRTGSHTIWSALFGDNFFDRVLCLQGTKYIKHPYSKQKLTLHLSGWPLLYIFES